MSALLRSGSVLLALACLVIASGCSYFRGIPSHGGGKRFEEEERAVAATIRRTIAGMDLGELEGKRTALAVNSIFTSGSGTTDWSGLTNVNVSGNRSIGESLLTQTTGGPAVSNVYGYENDSDSDNRAGTVSVGYRPNSSYRAANQNTEGDLNYFKAALEMKARLKGLSIVGQNPEVMLFVLVDVLGTNHSRRDFIFYANEQLLAACEVTYYAVEVKTGKVLFKARQASSAAKYSEGTFFFVPASTVSRSVCYRKPIYFDTEEPRASGSGPIEIPEDLGEVMRACRQMDSAEQDQVLETLADRVRFHLESGNVRAARENLDAIREIDPGYKGLGDLANEVPEAGAAGK